MANEIKLKRRTAGAVGAPVALKSGELAWNQVDDTIYGGKGDDGGGNATSVVPIGGEGHFAKKDSPALTGTQRRQRRRAVTTPRNLPPRPLSRTRSAPPAAVTC